MDSKLRVLKAKKNPERVGFDWYRREIKEEEIWFLKVFLSLSLSYKRWNGTLQNLLPLVRFLFFWSYYFIFLLIN